MTGPWAIRQCLLWLLSCLHDTTLMELYLNFPELSLQPLSWPILFPSTCHYFSFLSLWFFFFYLLDFLNHLMLWLRFWNTPYFLALKNYVNSEVSKTLSQVLKSWLNKTWNCMFNISIQIIIKRLVFCVFKTDPFSLFHSDALFSGLPVFVTVTFFYLIFKTKTLNSQLTPFLLSGTLFLSFSNISYTHVLHIIVAFTTAKEVIVSISLLSALLRVSVNFQLLWKKIPWAR